MTSMNDILITSEKTENCPTLQMEDKPLYSFVSLIVYIIAVVAYKRKAAYFTINTHKTGLNASTGHCYNQKFAPDFPPQIPVLATLVYWGVAPATPALFTPTFPERAGLLASWSHLT